ncbi:MAG: hypothetical protein JSV03_17285 [Planctomycetota bacterium]|nr:MAG: hypothetical protein JSV03_17285 [Planctomycetota bacterium]
MEIRNALCGKKYDLVVRVLENMRPVMDKDCKPVQFVVPLDCATKIRCSKINYEKAVKFKLPDGVICNPRKVKVDVIVVPHGGGCVMAQRDRTPKHRYCCK